MKPDGKNSVVIIDDDALIREVLRLILREAGYEVVAEAGDGAAGLAAVARHRPAAVCLDINMPGESGLAVLEKIKAGHPDMPVIMITGDATAETVKDAIAKGARGYVLKPFNPARVFAAMEACLQPPADQGKPDGAAP